MAAEDEGLTGSDGARPVPEAGPVPLDERRPGTRSVPELLLGRPPMARPLPSFDHEAAPAEPGPLFVEWLATALDAGVLDPQAFTLSTVDADGVPDARVLVLRDMDAAGTGWNFSAAADSPKGRQLANHPAAALTVYWPQLGRQVRVRGTVERAADLVAAAEFATRSPAARVGALVGRQSEPLASLAEYDEAVAVARRRLEVTPDAVAPWHAVYTLWAHEVEFWQGDAQRRHVRLRYTRSGPVRSPEWSRTLLWP
ncbi:pyridoxal 5'-phosphate synthase [Kitasatospora sp. SUK 42]|uniref:pyridoxine/pyridoxamine 5'-phosphate oxidase n=1 Tax=Kitasatospora sp. SUK 42 TaxID=1588882 RepID=UPI0018CBCE84|nr:pyridoxal 5'-phosphate synthase [Kitasatospora sp. SUK 42]MBV2152963.1 pyridoxal 5'-phosphate synthase [Kitasatospora sp. SUK 42]